MVDRRIKPAQVFEFNCGLTIDLNEIAYITDIDEDFGVWEIGLKLGQTFKFVKYTTRSKSYQQHYAVILKWKALKNPEPPVVTKDTEPSVATKKTPSTNEKKSDRSKTTKSSTDVVRIP